MDDLRALFREVAATPLPASLEASPAPAEPPAGEPADEQTVAEVNAVWRMYVACLSAGDQPRMFALYSDAMVRRQLMVDIGFGVTEDALFSSSRPRQSRSRRSRPSRRAPRRRAVLSDSRVAVVGTGEQGRGDVRIFVKAGDGWVLDDWYDLA